MLRFSNVTKVYPRSGKALDDVSFSLRRSEFAFLTGSSGAGKSTLLKLIALLERPTRGRVWINGQNTAQVPMRRVPHFRRGLGVVFQDHRLLMDRPVFDNVALPLIVAGVAFRDLERRVRAALDQVGLLGRERAVPLELSIGEQQRVGIARAIVGRPPLLIADEPTGNLDPTLASEVMALFRRFHSLGVTVLIATHDLALVRASGLRELQLAAGTLEAQAPLASA